MSALRKIRVAHVVGSLQYGGAENQVVQILNGLNSDHILKYLIVFKKVETANSRVLSPEIVCFTVNPKRCCKIRRIIELYRFFRYFRIDVVQAHMYRANLYVAVAAWLARVPVVLTTEHGKNLWKKPMHHFIEKRIISPLVRMRIAVSKDIREIRVKTGDVSINKITVIPNCVKIPKIATLRRYREQVRIGTVGRLVAAKDYATLIIAFKRLTDDGFNVELIFVGDGPERTKLEKKVIDLALSEHITFVGFQEDINYFLCSFDIFILSSIREGIPVSMLEAMAMNVPVVATNVGGIPEVIQDSEDGLLVESRNPEMIADALKRLIEDDILRKKIGEAGRKKVKDFFSCEAICKQYENLYIELLDHRDNR